MTRSLLGLAREATPELWAADFDVPPGSDIPIRVILPCTNGLCAWFEIACVRYPEEQETGYTDGALSEAKTVANADFIAAANPKRIIELCEAIEKLIHSIEVHTHVASDNAPDTCAECGRNIRAQAHRYVGEPSKEVQQREAIAFARHALRGE